MGLRGYSYTEKVKRRKIFMKFFLLVIFMVLVFHLITIYLFKTYKIQSKTMQPTLTKGEFVLLTPLFNVDSGARRGELVLRKPLYDNNLNILQKFVNGVSDFFTFNMYKPFSINTKPALKKSFHRIVGLPGDSIYMKDYTLYVKPAHKDHFLTEFELAEIDYNINLTKTPNDWTDDLPFSGNMKEITLAKDEYFLLCDNRVGSMDSRFWGAVTSDDIEGKLLVRYWPIKKISRLGVDIKK